MIRGHNVFAVVVVIIMLIIVIVLIGERLNRVSRNDKLEKFYATRGYIYFRNFLEDCTLVNKDFRIISFVIRQGDNPRCYFRYVIKFRDLGMCVVSPAKHAMQIAEHRIQADYEAAISYCEGNDLQEIVVKEFNKANHKREELQKDFENYFYNALFNGKRIQSRKFVITTPFEAYAGSAGKYIVDTDYWKEEGDDAVYTGLMVFEQEYSEFIPDVIEETVKELFPNAKVTRYSDGCYIQILNQ